MRYSSHKQYPSRQAVKEAFDELLAEVEAKKRRCQRPLNLREQPGTALGFNLPAMCAPTSMRMIFGVIRAFDDREGVD